MGKIADAKKTAMARYITTKVISLSKYLRTDREFEAIYESVLKDYGKEGLDVLRNKLDTLLTSDKKLQPDISKKIQDELIKLEKKIDPDLAKEEVAKAAAAAAEKAAAEDAIESIIIKFVDYNSSPEATQANETSCTATADEKNYVESFLNNCAKSQINRLIGYFHGVMYLDYNPQFFRIPDDILYIETSIIGKDLLALADKYIREFMLKFNFYMNNIMQKGSTGVPELDYVLSECSIYFPNNLIAVRYLLGNPPGISQPPIGTEFYTHDGSPVDTTKFAYIINALNGWNLDYGTQLTGTNRAYITNKTFLEAIRRRLLPDNPFTDTDFVGKPIVVWAAACASKRVSGKLTNTIGPDGSLYIKRFKQIYDHQIYQIKKLIEIFGKIFADKYNDKDRTDSWWDHYSKNPAYVGLGITPGYYWTTICPTISVPDIRFADPAFTWAIPGFSMKFGISNILDDDNIAMDHTAIENALVTVGAHSENSSVTFASHLSQPLALNPFADSKVSRSQPSGFVPISASNTTAAARKIVEAAAAQMTVQKKQPSGMESIILADRPAKIAARAAIRAMAQGGGGRRKKSTRRRKRTNKKRTTRKH